MARSRPDPAAFAFRAEMVRDPAPELDDAAHTCLGNVLAQRQEVTGAWLVRERRTRVVHGSDDEGTTTHLVLHLATASASGNGAGMTCDDAVALAPGLPEVSVGTACGTPALRVRKAFSGRVREGGEALALRCGAGERPLPIEASPGALRVTPHPGSGRWCSWHCRTRARGSCGSWWRTPGRNGRRSRWFVRGGPSADSTNDR